VVAKFASEITSAAAQIAQSTSRTSAAVSQGAATAEEVRQSARLVGEKTERVAESSKHAAEALQVGTEATDETLGKMELIREQMESIGDTVVRLSEHSQAVEEIIETVKDLSEQSNLLAVNASIEAARAGDQGRGFSVVAQEIKSLAEQSREATVQVRSILEDTRKWINAVVLGTEHGNRAVQAGVRQAGLAGDTIKTLANAMSNWTQAAGMVHASSEQQAAGAEQVSIAMTSIDEAMRQNLHGISQLEKTARELEKLADTLARTLERYKV